MQLTDRELDDATIALHTAGILGADARTSLAGVCMLAGNVSLAEFRMQIASWPEERVSRYFGADWVRAAWALRNRP